MVSWVEQPEDNAYLFKRCGSSCMPGISKKAGNVILLKSPKTIRNPSARPGVMKSLRGTALLPIAGLSSTGEVGVVLGPAMRCISTRHHSTNRVSTELENVWVWKVQVTYDDATRVTAFFRLRGDWTSSWIAQSSSTKHSANMTMRRV